MNVKAFPPAGQDTEQLEAKNLQFASGHAMVNLLEVNIVAGN